jgi:hypothetical protein
MNTYVRAFIAGSAFPVTLWPFLYLGISYTLNPTTLKMGLVPLTIPLLMGLSNCIYVYLAKKYLTLEHNGFLWLFGGTYGLLLTSYGNFVAHIPTDLFLLSGAVQYVTIPIAVLTYAAVWRYIVKRLNTLLNV